MSLQAQLDAARRRGAARHARHAQRSRPHTSAAMERRETIEKVTAAAFGLDFLADLDTMLAARSAQLWVVWKGKRGQVYATHADGTIEVLIEAHKVRRTVMPDFSGEIGGRLFALMRAHNISLVAAWRDGLFVLQAGNAEVSTTHCLALIRCSEGRKCRYWPEGEPAS